MPQGEGRSLPAFTRLAGGEMAERVKAFDWSKTPLGPRAAWSPSLALAVDMLMATNFPMALRWGPELILIYNDAYAPSLRERHPDALGRPFTQHSDAFRATLLGIHQDILSGESGGYALERMPLQVEREAGEARLAHFAVSYSPVPDQTAPSGVGGVLISAVEITGAVETEKELRATRARYDMALDAAGGVGAWEWDIKANRVYCDARYAQLHQVDPTFASQGLPAQSFTPAVHDEDRERVRQIALAAMQTGGDFADEYRLVQADGSVRWVAASGHCYLDADGQADRNAGVVFDITERKRMEGQLLEARLDRDIAMEAAGMGRWDHNPSTGQRYWDKRSCEMFGVAEPGPQDFDSFLALLHPDDVDTVLAAVAAATDPDGDGLINVEYRIVRPSDGALRWIEVFGRAYFERGACVRFVGVGSDVTERKEAARKLVSQEETLRLAIEAADVGTWDLDIRNDVLTWSDRCYAMFGVAPGTPVVRDDFYTNLHPSDRDAVREALRRTLDGRIRADYDVEFRVIGREDGVERWLSAKGKAFFDNEGKPIRMIGTTVNITDRKRAELHLRLLVNELNHRVKNSLATIQAIAGQTFHAARSLPAAQEAFTARIIALSEAHDVLTRENWEGADLLDVVDRLVALHGGEGRFVLDGPSVRLSPRPALSLSMALHELATNAVKYGALSRQGGQVTISWSVDYSGVPRLSLRWRESGGPPVVAPTRRGFGSRLIERGLAQELSGEARIDFKPEGVECAITALLDC
ncbi:histidine kinase [Caulobacter radicis]|jgi:PAS domain S-box-containing protein|uniref:histidine kinase n=1 Tax=Caulobacter radicis TaxID=2172650 RepID=A0A2T9IXU6_9CAUL|nr:histidine kinase [Caulobacter radicis]